MAKIAISDIVAALKEMTLLEINDLVKAIEEEFGVTAAAPVAVAAAPQQEAEEAGPSEFDVIVKATGPNKVQVIRAIQGATGLGLLDAKKLLDTLPCVVKEKASPAEAEEIKAKLVEAGAEVELKG